MHQGPSGAVHCTWSPGGSVLLVASDFNLRLSAWNLRTRAVVHLKGPKCAKQGLGFSGDGQQLATLEVCALRVQGLGHRSSAWAVPEPCSQQGWSSAVHGVDSGFWLSAWAVLESCPQQGQSDAAAKGVA